MLKYSNLNLHWYYIGVVLFILVTHTDVHSTFLNSFADVLSSRSQEYFAGRRNENSQPSNYSQLGYNVYHSHINSSLPVYSGFQFTLPAQPLWQGDIMGHFITINNPFETFSVLEPGKASGCETVRRATVKKSAEQKKCVVAMNAGMFNVTSDKCLGNVVVDGKTVQRRTDVKNAHFGIKKDKSIFIGYVPQDADLQQFQQLVGGVIWMVRDGQNYVSQAIVEEREETQNTSTLLGFASCLSGRTAIGHNAEGQVVMATVDGKTWESGISLFDFADLLISFGVVNAINLDGGGSTTLVIENTVFNHPSDFDIDEETKQKRYKVREVGTIVCAHDHYVTIENLGIEHDSISQCPQCHAFL